MFGEKHGSATRWAKLGIVKERSERAGGERTTGRSGGWDGTRETRRKMETERRKDGERGRETEKERERVKTRSTAQRNRVTNRLRRRSDTN